ncbi:MAG: hypothetical protein SF052_15770 [Bacteroidia bacterium]|nr:hypothetical protein [Bacteroidia bacterium]
MILTGVNSLSADSYFIRLSDNKKYYIHPGKTIGDETEYLVKEGAVGAAIWRKAQAEEFINFTRANNLELVKVSDLLGNDGTLN